MANILVVEDESVVAWHLQTVLESFNYHVIGSTDSGAEAVQVAAAIQPDLVLMDIRLAGAVDGISAAEEIYKNLSIPVVYLTAHADRDTLQRAILSNPFGYLVKPFQEQELNTTIQVALRRHRLSATGEA